MTRPPVSAKLLERLREAAAPVAEAAPAPGTSLGKYRLGRLLGSGAMGLVYLAEDVELRREVAIKLLRDTAAGETLRARFQREARAAARLSHPNVVKVHDAGEIDGRMYLVMEPVDGRPLSEIFAGRRFEQRPMLRLLEKVARGVAAAHAAGIVHRDLKPANILVGADGEPKVGDFGLAHWVGSDSALTKTGTPLGTPAYMAPEQVRGGAEGVSPATDVYGLGAILYEILTGRTPHTGDSSVEIYSKVISDEPIDPRRLNAKLHADLRTICLKALEKEPARRYATASEFGDDLRRHLDGEAILARPPGRVRRARLWFARHQVAGAVVAMAAAGVMVAVAAWAFRASAQRREIRAIVADARRLLDACRGKEEQAARDERRAQELGAALQPHDDAAKKQPLWDAEQGVRVARREAASNLAEAAARLQSALTLDPADAEARRLMAGIHAAEAERAEREGDEARRELSLKWVEAYDDGTLLAALKRPGTLTLETVPAGAKAEFFRYEEGADRRLVPTATGQVATLPLRDFPLKPGSWLVVLSRDGCRAARVPLRILRGRPCTGTIALHTDAEIGADFVQVPGGIFLSGGERRDDGEPQEPVETAVGDVFIGRCEVTMGEYLGYLDALVAAGRVAEARARLPRIGEALLAVLQADGRCSPVPDYADLRRPAVGVSWDDAAAYAAWRSAADARSDVRLPTEAEWEHAARGADGRVFPWGNAFDWSFAWTIASRERVTGPAPVGSFGWDESPCGARDMAGNVSEWCADVVDEWKGMRATRGGSWDVGAAEACHAGRRSYVTQDVRAISRGFRLAKTPRREH